MFGQFTGFTGSTTTVFEAFMENEGEYVLTASVDGVEISRVVLAEGFALALADLFDRDAAAYSTAALASLTRGVNA
jgi:hypothetical protein